jgi:hypothetical protein
MGMHSDSAGWALAHVGFVSLCSDWKFAINKELDPSPLVDNPTVHTHAKYRWCTRSRHFATLAQCWVNVQKEGPLRFISTAHMQQYAHK